MTRRHRVALIGLGMAVTPHAKSLLDLADRAEVVYALSPSEARRKSLAGRFPFPTTDSLDRILEDRSVDIAAVLTPPNTHLEIAAQLAKAGKHVLLEKPLEISTARAEQLVAACHDAKVTLGVVLQHRFKPAAERLAAILKAGELGPIVNCSTSIRLWRPQSYYDEPGRGTRARDGGGVLITQGIHTLDLMLSLAGPIVEVAGYAVTSPVHRMETEDTVCAAVRFASGAIGVIDATTAAYPGLGGADRAHRHDGHGVARRHRAQRALPRRPGGGDRGGRFGRRHRRRSDGLPARLSPGRVARFPGCGGRRAAAPRISGAEALKVHRLIDALLAAGATDRKIKVDG